MKSSKKSISLGPLPLTIGVVGHRNIEESEKVRVRLQFKTVLQDFHRQSPATPVILLTALAEGADQIAAEEGFDLDFVEVWAILPMPIEEYEKDFKEEENLLKFMTLLKKCTKVINSREFSKNFTSSFATEALSNSEQDVLLRDFAYRDCGRAISRLSYVLIAIWDGQADLASAGTVDTINHRLGYTAQNASHKDEVSLLIQESGQLIHIPALRNIESLNPFPTVTDTIEVELTLINSDERVLPWKSGSIDETVVRVNKINEWILREQNRKETTQKPLTPLLMSVVDAQAERSQVKFRQILSLLLIFGIATLFLVDLGIMNRRPWISLGALTCSVFTASLWMRFLRGNFKDDSLQMRTLVEGLRVQTTWVECGVEERPSDYYLKGSEEVSWIPRVLETAWFSDKVLKGNPELTWEEITASAKEWMTSQVLYFEGKSWGGGAIRKNILKRKFYERISIGGVLLSLISGALMATRYFIHGSQLVISTKDLVVVIFHFFLSISAASAAYSQMMAFKEISRQYEINLKIFRKGLVLLSEESRNGESLTSNIQDLVTKVGIEALRETSMWFALKRDRMVHPL